MIRIIGAVLVICATSAIGISGVFKLRNRVRTLEAIIGALELMENEICSRMTPTRDVLEILSKDADMPVRCLFENAGIGMARIGSCSFASIWRSAIEDSKELQLTDEEAETLASLGMCLGRYDVREQAAAIARVRRRMDAYLLQAENVKSRDSKLHAFFGVASGIFAVVILL